MSTPRIISSFVPELGLDKVLAYHFNSAAGTIAANRSA